MKKLFVLAAIVVSATSYAQTINGTINYDVTNKNGATSSGLSDTTLVIGATEKIGSLDVAVKLGLDGAARDKTLAGRDASIRVGSALGSLTLGQVEVGNGLSTNTFGLISGIGSDGVVVAGVSNQNLIKYETPSIGPVAFSVTDTQPTAGGSHSQVYGVTASAGALSGAVDYTAQTNRVRTSAQYNFGFAKVGAGLSANEDNVKNSYVVAVAVPVGPASVGGAFYNGDGKSYEAAVSYPLSKRTSVALAYRDVTSNSVAGNNTGTTRFRVQHTF